MKKQISISIIMIFFFASSIFSQSLGNFFITSGSIVQYNQAPLPSSPSPFYFNIGIGGRIPFNQYINISPLIQGFAGYYLWDENKALPSSPENRTTYTPQLLLDLPILFELPYQNSFFSIGIGIAFFIRYGFLTNGVPESDYEDVDLINSWYWQNIRFLYPSVQLNWDYLLSNGTAIGIGIKAFIPLGNYLDENPISTIQDGLLSISARFFFKNTTKNKTKKPVEEILTQEENPQPALILEEN